MKKLCVVLMVLLTIAVMPLFAADNSLTSVKQRRTLIVCTTSDYPPLTEWKRGRFRGETITRAKSLAKYLAVKVKFVKTSWPDLAKDLSRHKCDIAMGGISQSPERAKQFLLTKPVQKFGRVPLVRCRDRDRFNTLAKIDRSNVRVVENPGGTNEKFARSKLKYAEIVVPGEKEDVFKYLLQGKADVMFTDTIEAQYRHRKVPGLCVVNPGRPLTAEYQVYMLPKQSNALLQKVNQWIKLKRIN